MMHTRTNSPKTICIIIRTNSSKTICIRYHCNSVWGTTVGDEFTIVQIQWSHSSRHKLVPKGLRYQQKLLKIDNVCSCWTFQMLLPQLHMFLHQNLRILKTHNTIGVLKTVLVFDSLKMCAVQYQHSKSLSYTCDNPCTTFKLRLRLVDHVHEQTVPN